MLPSLPPESLGTRTVIRSGSSRTLRTNKTGFRGMIAVRKEGLSMRVVDRAGDGSACLPGHLS